MTGLDTKPAPYNPGRALASNATVGSTNAMDIPGLSPRDAMSSSHQAGAAAGGLLHRNQSLHNSNRRISDELMQNEGVSMHMPSSAAAAPPLSDESSCIPGNKVSQHSGLDIMDADREQVMGETEPHNQQRRHSAVKNTDLMQRSQPEISQAREGVGAASTRLPDSQSDLAQAEGRVADTSEEHQAVQDGQDGREPTKPREGEQLIDDASLNKDAFPLPTGVGSQRALRYSIVSELRG